MPSMSEQHNEQEVLDLHSYLRPVWRRKWIILAIVVVATAATYFISSRQPKTYVASTSLYLQSPDPTLDVAANGSPSPLSSEQIADVAQLVLAQPVTQAVAQQLGMPVASAGSVTATPAAGTDFITISATSRSAVLAARLANTYASTYVQSRKQAVKADATRDLAAAQGTLASLPSNPKSLSDLNERQTLLQQIQSYNEIALNPSGGASQINPATPPDLPASPKPTRDAIFGGVVGLVLALIVAFCLELLDRRLARVSTVASIYGRPVLAVLSHVSNPTPMLNGQRPTVPPEFVEELRSLTVMLRLGSKLEPPRTIMVTSALPKEGKSTVVRDLALVYAESGDHVLVIDGDLRRPSMERLFGVSAELGLTQILLGHASLSDAAVRAIVPSPVADASTNGSASEASLNGAGAPSSLNGAGAPSSNGGDPRLRGSVDVLLHGESIDNPLALQFSLGMVALLEEASKAYDIVIVDTPPVLTVADTVPLLELVDCVLLVARLGQTTRHAARRFNDLMDRLPDVTFSGVVVNDRREQFDDEGYGSYGRYGYGYYRDNAKRSKRKEKAEAAAS